MIAGASAKVTSSRQPSASPPTCSGMGRSNCTFTRSTWKSSRPGFVHSPDQIRGRFHSTDGTESRVARRSCSMPGRASANGKARMPKP